MTEYLQQTPKRLNPREIIRDLHLEGKKMKRQVAHELEGLDRDEQVQKLHELFPTDPVWSNN